MSGSGDLKIWTGDVTLATPGETTLHDLTTALRDAILASGLREGQALAFVPGSTAAISFIEYEPGLLRDIPAALERLAPRHADYHHHGTWGDDNGSSHVRAALIGPSEIIPFRDGEPILGTWQQLVLIDLDTRPRKRRVVFQLTGI